MPIRRYLRITKYSVLECRIYLDNPADVHRWLLNTASPVLPRVIDSVRPLVLPKLREENARAKSSKGSSKKKGWKDVVVEDDFEVAVFLTEVSTRHTLLRKEKTAKNEKARLGTVDGRLTGAGTMDIPFEVENGSEIEILEVESREEERTNLRDIPMNNDGDGRDSTEQTPGSEQSLFVSEDSAEDDSPRMQQHEHARGKHDRTPIDPEDGNGDDKKKMSLSTTYDGFSIYGRILCLVVKRRGVRKGKDSAGETGQAMMEEWIASTQMEG